jgi:hypothetical protein
MSKAPYFVIGFIGVVVGIVNIAKHHFWVGGLYILFGALWFVMAFRKPIDRSGGLKIDGPPDAPKPL